MAAISQTILSNEFSLMKMLEFWLKFHWSLFLRGPINNIKALVQIMAWRRPGDKPLSEPMLVSLLTHNGSLGLNELMTWWSDDSIVVSTNTEMVMSSFWQNFITYGGIFIQWLHWKLSKWQLPVQPVQKILSRWGPFDFSAGHKFDMHPKTYRRWVLFPTCRFTEVHVTVKFKHNHNRDQATT